MAALWLDKVLQSILTLGIWKTQSQTIFHGDLHGLYNVINNFPDNWIFGYKTLCIDLMERAERIEVSYHRSIGSGLSAAASPRLFLHMAIFQHISF